MKDYGHPLLCKILGSQYFLDPYSDYCYTHLIRENSAEEKNQEKGVYKRLAATHRTRVYAIDKIKEDFWIPSSKSHYIPT